jgi:glycosyltransferase involved in cell wall biosynthesis
MPVGASQKTNIACVILTLNEEINLPRCLKSVSWCDQVIVLDSGSSDSTHSVAKSLGAVLLVNKQSGTFNIAQQRNWVLERKELTCEWVLFLDADEEIASELKQAILSAIENPKGKNCFELTPKYLFWGKWLRRTQGFPNWHPRLLRVGQVQFAGGVWEHFGTNASVGRIPEPYNHYANSKGFSDWLSRHDRYSNWDAIKVVNYLSSGDTVQLGTQRKIQLRRIAARLYPLRPLARFLNCYFVRRGFLEGVPALVFSLMYAFYELMTVIKIIEIRRAQNGKPL